MYEGREVRFFRGCHVGHHNVVLTLCEGSETLTEWKYESMTNSRTTEGLTGVDARDAFASKKSLIELSMYSTVQYLQNFGRRSMDSKRQSLDRKSDRQSSCVHFEPDPRVKIQEKLDFGITRIYV